MRAVRLRWACNGGVIAFLEMYPQTYCYIFAILNISILLRVRRMENQLSKDDRCVEDIQSESIYLETLARSTMPLEPRQPQQELDSWKPADVDLESSGHSRLANVLSQVFMQIPNSLERLSQGHNGPVAIVALAAMFFAFLIVIVLLIL
jgi:hypothetical protein